MSFKHIILAGTFDHLHFGHKQFINTATNKASLLSCGLTTNWVKKNKKYPLAIQSYKKRFQNLKNFLEKEQEQNKVKIFPLNDAFGPAISNPKIDAIATTKENLKTSFLINKKRGNNGLKPLSINLIDLVKTKDHQKLSSTRIRKGEINCNGLIYQQLFPKNKTLYLPSNQRSCFKKPMGQLLTGPTSNISWTGLKASKKIRSENDHPLDDKNHQFPLIITVGDITTQAFFLNKLPINLAIIDHRCQRKPIAFNLHRQIKKTAGFNYLVKNNPGTLSPESINLFQKTLLKTLFSKQTGIIQVKGEEDLLVLPAILLSPLKTLVFYGQPNKGLVQVEVTEEAKNKALNLLKKFSY